MPDSNEQPTDGTEAQSDAPQFDFTAWLGEQPEHVRSGLESHTAGLKSALDGEREQRKEFSRQLREATAKAEKGSEIEKALNETSSRLEVAEQRAAFFEDAGKAEIACTNPRAAFLIAQAEGLFRKSGEPDWAAIKASAPELFGRKTPPGNAGSGNGSPPPRSGGMNEYIRAASGRS